MFVRCSFNSPATSMGFFGILLVNNMQGASECQLTERRQPPIYCFAPYWRHQVRPKVLDHSPWLLRSTRSQLPQQFGHTRVMARKTCPSLQSSVPAFAWLISQKTQRLIYLFENFSQRSLPCGQAKWRLWERSNHYCWERWAGKGYRIFWRSKTRSPSERTGMFRRRR